MLLLGCPLLVSNDAEASKLRRATPGGPLLLGIFDVLSVSFPVKKVFQVLYRNLINIVWGSSNLSSGVKCHRILAARK